MFDFSKVLPSLLRKDVEYGENNFPEVPDHVPEVVAAGSELVSTVLRKNYRSGLKGAK